MSSGDVIGGCHRGMSSGDVIIFSISKGCLIIAIFTFTHSQVRTLKDYLNVLHMMNARGKKNQDGGSVFWI